MNSLSVNEPTSLKEIIQSLAPSQIEIIRGRVTQVAPLRIQIINDDKLILNENTAIVPWYLTDYTTRCDIELRAGTINSQTHQDGAHAHPGVATAGAHVNTLDTFNIYSATIRQYNGLKVGEMVFILSFNHGKKYFVLDREVDYDAW